MCNLHWCYTFCTGVTLFALVLHLNCTALSQSESSNFFVYIIMPRSLWGPLTLFKLINNVANKIIHIPCACERCIFNHLNKFLTQKLQNLCHNFLGTNRPEGWVWTDLKWVRNVLAWVRNVWVWNIHGYETTGKLHLGTCVGVCAEVALCDCKSDALNTLYCSVT